MTRRRPLLSIITFILIIILSVVTSSAVHISSTENGYNILDIYPSSTVMGGESVLVLSDASHLTITFNVTIIVQGQGKETRYTWTDELVVEGIKWPYADNLYFYIIPGMPANDTIFIYSGTPYIVKVRSQATLTIYQVHETINQTITWTPVGERNREPVAILYVPDGDKYTLYLSPSGWTKPAGTDLQVMVIGYGFHGEPTANLFVGSGENYIQYSMEKYEKWWNSLGKIIDDIVEWFKSLEIKDGRLAGHLPAPEYSGGIWTASIPMKYKGSQIYYYGRIVDSQGETAYTPKGTVIVTSSDGPRIVMVDDDLLLYLIGAENKEIITKLLVDVPESNLLNETYTLGDALLASGLIRKHYYDVLASNGQLVIAFPGNDTLAKLSGGATIIYVSGLPPSVPETILDWNRTSLQFISLLENLTKHGSKLIVTATSIASIPYDNENTYPYTITGLNNTGLAVLTGMKHLIFAYDTLNNRVIAPLPEWSGTLYSTSDDPTIPHRVEVNTTTTVVGWQGIIPNCQPSIVNADLLRSPWLTLLDKGITGLPLKNIAEKATQVNDEIQKTSYYLGISKIKEDKLVIFLENKTVSIPVKWITTYLSDTAVPVMLSNDCMSGIFLYSPVYPRAIVFTFEPESDPTGGPVLLTWALEKLLEPSIPPTKLDDMQLPLDVVHKANKLAQAGSEWKENLIPGGGLVLNTTSNETVLVIPYGKISVIEGRLLFQDLRGLVYKVEGERITVVPRETYYIIPVAIAPAKKTATTPITTTAPTMTTTTNTGTMTTTTTTTTTTSVAAGEGIDWRVIALISAAAVMAVVAILYYRKRHPYKYI